MIDTYLASCETAELETFCLDYENVIPIQQGRSAVESSIDVFGNQNIGIPAVGDTTKFYTCIRADHVIEVSDPIEIVSFREGEAVVGGWSVPIKRE